MVALSSKNCQYIVAEGNARTSQFKDTSSPTAIVTFSISDIIGAIKHNNCNC